MKGSSFATLLGFAVLLALAAGVYFLFKYVTGVFSSLDPEVETLAWIGAIVALLCAVIIAEGLKARRQDGPETADRARLYERLLARCCERLRTGARAADPALEQSLALRGGSKVVAAYLALQAGMPDDAPLLGRLLAEMRADLGHLTQLRNEDEVLAMLVGRGGGDGKPAAGGSA